MIFCQRFTTRLEIQRTKSGIAFSLIKTFPECLYSIFLLFTENSYVQYYRTLRTKTFSSVTLNTKKSCFEKSFEAFSLRRGVVFSRSILALSFYFLSLRSFLMLKKRKERLWRGGWNSQTRAK